MNAYKAPVATPSSVSRLLPVAECAALSADLGNIQATVTTDAASLTVTYGSMVGIGSIAPLASGAAGPALSRSKWR